MRVLHCFLRVAVVVTFIVANQARGATFLIGNSLTDNGAPWALDGSVAYDIQYGQSLMNIAANAVPVLGPPGSQSWRTALNPTYDALVVQPYLGSTLAGDVAAINGWLQQTPTATVVIHTGWPWLDKWNDWYAVGHSGQAEAWMNFSPEYMAALRQGLQAAHPGLQVKSTYVNEALAKIAVDCQTGAAPYSSFAELYRDPVHLSWTDGSYLVHNALRIALGQPTGAVGYESLSAQRRGYLDGVLAAVSTDRVVGDFDRNQKVDGADLLAWQRGARSTVLLADWRSQFGANGSATPLATAIPEPVGATLSAIAAASVAVFSAIKTQPRPSRTQPAKECTC